MLWWKRRLKKKLSCLGGDGGGDSGGLAGKRLLLLLLLLSLLLLFELKDIVFSFNVFNLLCISISMVFGAFFISVLATSCLPVSSSCNKESTFGFCAQK